MRNRTVCYRGALGLVLCLAWSPLANATPTNGNGQDSGQSTLSAEQAMSDDDRKKAIDKMEGEIASIMSSSYGVVEEGRTSSSLAVKTCVDEKFNALTEISQNADKTRFQLVGGQIPAVNAYQSMVTHLGQAREKKKQLELCVAKGNNFAGNTTVSVTTDPTLSDKDPTQTNDPDMSPNTPEAASPS